MRSSPAPSADTSEANTHSVASRERVLVSEELIRLIGQWQRKRVVVVGDLMMDRYIFGNAERLSPDAPVPVLTAQRMQQQPGGSANVCLDLIALRCDVVCVGVVGDDTMGHQLRDAMASAGCDTSGIITVPDRPTTVKQNFVGLAQHRHPQKMFRVDEESAEPLSSEVLEQLLDCVRLLLRDAAVLCLEDYGKGLVIEELCAGLIDLAGQWGTPVLVDPANIDNYRRYRGATCITPNRTEAALATGEVFDRTVEPAVIEQMGRRLMSLLHSEAVVITGDQDGLFLFEKGCKVRQVPAEARAVYDVTGAGDMVLAGLAAARANGAAWHVAVELANTAAGLEVERFGVEPIDLEEILLKLLDRQQSGKTRCLDDLLTALAAHRSQGRRIVFTNGCFDILHAGHVWLLREARSRGDLLVVGVNSDDAIRLLKGSGRPIHQLCNRLTVLAELESVDYIVVFEEPTPRALIEAIRPDVLIKGAEYTKDEIVGAELVESYGGRVERIAIREGLSTTSIIQKVKCQA